MVNVFNVEIGSSPNLQLEYGVSALNVRSI